MKLFCKYQSLITCEIVSMKIMINKNFIVWITFHHVNYIIVFISELLETDCRDGRCSLSLWTQVRGPMGQLLSSSARWVMLRFYWIPQESIHDVVLTDSSRKRMTVVSPRKCYWQESGQLSVQENLRFMMALKMEDAKMRHQTWWMSNVVLVEEVFMRRLFDTISVRFIGITLITLCVA